MLRFLIFPALFSFAACAPLLDADFEDMNTVDFAVGPVDLPGAPAGDRVIVLDGATPSISIEPGNRSLILSRDVLVQAPPQHETVFFDPIDTTDGAPIIFKWTGEIAGFDSGDTVAVAAKLKDLSEPDQPNFFSKFIIRLSSGFISVQPSGGVQTTVGFGVEGPHTVIFRINADNSYVLTVIGDGVSPNGGFTHDGNLGAGIEIDPDNIGMSLSFDDATPAGGAEFYRVDNVTITENES